MIELNLLGVVRCCRAAIPHLRRSTISPATVNVSSVNAFAALGSEPYSSAKAGIGSLTINLAASLAADGIRVNTVAPATIRTRNWEGQEGGSRSLPPPLSARTRRGTRGRRCRGRLPCFQRCRLDHRTHTPRRRRIHDRWTNDLVMPGRSSPTAMPVATLSDSDVERCGEYGGAMAT